MSAPKLSSLYDWLHDNDDHLKLGIVLAIEGYLKSKDPNFVDENSPVNSKNVKDYLNTTFLHEVLEFCASEGAMKPSLKTRNNEYQVFLVLWAMDYGVKIEEGDLEMAKKALVAMELLSKERNNQIKEAFEDYKSDGGWTLLGFCNKK